jgi:hypothetical protein
MAQYMLLIYDAESTWASMSEEEQEQVMGEYVAYTEELRASGAFVSGDALQPVGTARSVRVRDGERTVTDGPFSETKEILGGYYLVDVQSEEEALAWATKVPSARWGTIEVRPVVVFPQAEEVPA